MATQTNLTFQGTFIPTGSHIISTGSGTSINTSKIVEDATNLYYNGLAIQGAGVINATSINATNIKIGTGSRQILMSDGTFADINLLAKSTSLSSYVPINGSTKLTGNLTASSIIKSGGGS